MTESYFPIVILKNGDKNLSFIEEPERIPLGVGFKVLLTHSTQEEFRIADKIAKSCFCSSPKKS